MDLEKEVAIKLLEKGFPIFHKNLVIKRNKILITEYDIISNDFIIEVKSGKEVKSTKKQLLNQLRYLPDGYKLYYYCPLQSDVNIQYLNEDKLCNNLIFINNLEFIFKNQKVNNECNISNNSEFTKFLSVPFSLLKKFDKIFMTQETFYHTYLCSKYINDFKLKGENIYCIEKIIFLLENNIISFINDFDHTKPFFSTNKNLKSISVNENEKIKIPKIYFSDWSKCKLDNITIINGDIPFVNGITRLCKCGNRFIFGKWNFCYACDKERKLKHDYPEKEI